MIEHGEAHPHVEVGGVLVGRIGVDANTGSPYLELVDLLCSRAIGNAVHFTLQAEEMVEFDRLLTKTPAYEGYYQVGWFHTHPGHGVFLSGTDTNTHERFYPLDWNVAVVLDPQRKEIGFFFRAHEEYGLYSRINLYQWTDNLAKPRLNDWKRYLYSVITLHEDSRYEKVRNIRILSGEGDPSGAGELTKAERMLPKETMKTEPSREPRHVSPATRVESGPDWHSLWKWSLPVGVCLLIAGGFFFLGFCSANLASVSHPPVQIPDKLELSIDRPLQFDSTELQSILGKLASQQIQLDKISSDLSNFTVIERQLPTAAIGAADRTSAPHAQDFQPARPNSSQESRPLPAVKDSVPPASTNGGPLPPKSAEPDPDIND
jgi:proteasome lid subunit RPN8/RPN11